MIKFNKKFRKPFWQKIGFRLTLPLMFGRGTATVITKDLATDADKGRTLWTLLTLASQQVVNITSHGTNIHSGNLGQTSTQSWTKGFTVSNFAFSPLDISLTVSESISLLSSLHNRTYTSPSKPILCQAEPECEIVCLMATGWRCASQWYQATLLCSALSQLGGQAGHWLLTRLRKEQHQSCWEQPPSARR